MTSRSDHSEQRGFRWFPFVLFAFVMACVGTAFAGRLTEASPERLLSLGDTYLLRNHPDSAAAAYSLAMRRDPATAGQALAGLGRVALERGDTHGAGRLFDEAEQKAPGLGLRNYGNGLLAEARGSVDTALAEYQRAYWRDRRNPAYSVAIGQMLEEEGVAMRSEIRRRYKRALDIDSSYPPAHLSLAEFALRNGDYGGSLEHFEMYLLSVPDDPDVLFDAADMFLQRGRPEEARQLLAKNAARIPARCRTDVLFVAAACYLAEEQFEAAEHAMTVAMNTLSPEDRELYEDVSLVASPDEMETMERLREGGLTEDEVRSRFWLRRDMTPATRVNERRLEHYRRVWYAHRRFSQGRQPWDDRGKVYIRYGPPLHLLPHAARRDRPERAMFERRGGGRIGLVAGVQNWRYPDIGGEPVTFTFENSFDTGDYIFNIPDMVVFGAQEFSPAAKFASKVHTTPDEWTYGQSGVPFTFAYLHAQFNAPGDSSDVAIYYALPIGDLEFKQREEDGHYEARLERGYAVFDEDWDLIGREANELVFEASRGDGLPPGALKVDQQTVQLESGRRVQLNVQARDLNAGRLQMYRETMDVESFAEGLAISDIVLTTDVEAADEPSRFDQTAAFERGNLRIAPNAARMVPQGEPFGVYFEIYNLTRGPEYGETSYEVEHELRPVGEGGILGAIGRIVRGAERVGVARVMEGVRDQTVENFKIPTDNLDPGEYLLKVTVRDLKNDERVSRETRFLLVEQPE